MQCSNGNPTMLTGRPYPLGAVWDGEGVNFALFSQHATSVELCLFESPADCAGIARYRLPARTNHVWHGFLPGAGPGLLYGYRVHGPYSPHEGHRFNPNKLLIDPYARALSGNVGWDDAVHGYIRGDPSADLSFDTRDSAALVPKGIVIDPAFDWDDDRAPRTALSDTVIYECHVKGLTARHPDIPGNQRGTYLAVASDPIIAHLQGLGITAVELLPVHHALDDLPLVERGLVNYWGYSTIGFFAPYSRYATGSLGQQVVEFKSMVKGLHRAGIEVILDVVYNHTGEGDQAGPTLSFRGIDNAVYYRIRAHERRYYEDFSGCGNSLSVRHPRVLQLVMDSLRYWVEEMHVDGFRFDLATTLGRGDMGFDRWGAFFAAVQQDPVLTNVKLIAEPWDVGDGGYQVGNFPIGWSEWSDKYRSSIRAFWRGDHVSVGEMSRRLTGSSDLYELSGRGPCAGVNYVACHDGYTLHDLTCYEQKHNEANGEGNRDGDNHNLSCNWGVEGPTDDEVITACREKARRNLLGTLAFSLGVPMIAAGDELGRTQYGNNNAYCQIGDEFAVNWALTSSQQELLGFVREVLALRRELSVLRRGTHLTGQPGCAAGLPDVKWLRADGNEFTLREWHDGKRRFLGMLLHEHPEGNSDGGGADRAIQTIYVILNGDERSHRCRLPAIPEPGRWVWRVDTALTHEVGEPIGGKTLEISGQSLILLQYK